MSFSAVDDTKTAARAAETSACRDDAAADGLLLQLAAMGALRGAPLGSPEVRSAVCALQQYITAHFYPCTTPILSGLGQLYAADERFARRIDAAGGEGTAAFAAAAIAAYCEVR